MLLILSPCWACSCSCPHRKALHTCPTCSDVAASHIDGSNRNTVRINSDARYPNLTCVHLHMPLLPLSPQESSQQPARHKATRRSNWQQLYETRTGHWDWYRFAVNAGSQVSEMQALQNSTKI